MKRLLLSAACLSLSAMMVPVSMVAASVPANEYSPQGVTGSETMQDAFDKLIAEAKGQMMRDPTSALDLAKNAEAIAVSASAFNDKNIAIATAKWLQGEGQIRTGKPEAGAMIIDEALSLIGDEGLSTKLGGDLLLARGRVAGRLSDVQTAVQSFFKAHDTFVALDESRSEAMALQAIGSIYRDAEAFPRALEYYRKAGDVYGSDTILALTSFNNQANIFMELSDYKQARDYFLKALSLAETMKSAVLQGRILTNLADLEALSGNLKEAQRYVDRAYAHLNYEDNKEWKRFADGAQAHIFLAKGELLKAQDYIENGFADLDLDATNMSFEEMHHLAHEIYLARQSHEQALIHHKSFKRLSDSAKEVAASANLALLGVKFNVSQQNLNIERLKSERAKQEAQIAHSKQRDSVQAAVLAVSGLVILFFFIAAIAMRRHRNRVAKINVDLRQTVDRLNDEIKRRELTERDLTIAKEDAEQANRLKSTFLATMSHELRTPMNGILGFSKILLNGEMTQEQREQVEIIHHSGESLLCLINDILDISQIEAGKMTLNIAPFSLRSSIHDATKLLQSKASEKSLNLAVQIDPDLPTMVNGDSDRIRQIVMNLLGNAIKFTETGSVAVFVGKNETSDDIRISVVDTGVGIPSTKVDGLFDRFTQVDNSSTRAHDGSGLGLAICKELAEAMDGDIGVSTQIGEGSEFWVTLPLKAAEEVDVLSPEGTRRLGGKRVLVIDDLGINQRVYGLIFSAMNASHTAVSCAEDTIRTLMDARQNGISYDAIIISDTLAKIQSYELLNKLIKNNLTGMARLVLSAPGKVEEKSLKTMGFDAQIEQPITDDTVFTELRALILQDQVNEEGKNTAPSEVINLREKSQTMASASKNGGARHTTKKRQRVLVAEDNLANKQFVEAVLSSFDIDTDIVMNGAAAVECASQHDYDLILMDIHMPIMNGVDATKRIRKEHARNADTPIVALTAVAMPGDRTKFIRAGMDDVLAKPLELASLRSKINATLEQNGRVAEQGTDAASLLVDEKDRVSMG